MCKMSLLFSFIQPKIPKLPLIICPLYCVCLVYFHISITTYEGCEDHLCCCIGAIGIVSINIRTHSYFFSFFLPCKLCKMLIGHFTMMRLQYKCNRCLSYCLSFISNYLFYFSIALGIKWNTIDKLIRNEEKNIDKTRFLFYNKPRICRLSILQVNHFCNFRWFLHLKLMVCTNKKYIVHRACH